MTSVAGLVILDEVYSIHTLSGPQEYRAGMGLEIVGGSYVPSNSGDILLAARESVSCDGSSVVSSAEDDISAVTADWVWLEEDAFFHSDRRTIPIDTGWLTLDHHTRLGRGSGSHGPIDIRCARLVFDSTTPQGKIHGSTVEAHLKDVSALPMRGAALDRDLVRAETGDLVIRSESPIHCRGSLQARGGIWLDSEDDIGLGDAEINTDDRTEGASGSIRIRSWAGSEGSIDVSGARLTEPGLYLAKPKASVKGAGRDKFSLTLVLTTDGTTPAAASDLTIGFGESVPTTIPAASFTRNGDRHEFRGDVDGIRRVVVDFTREKITVKGMGLDLGTVPVGANEVDASVGLGDETRALTVRMVRRGSSLRY